MNDVFELSDAQLQAIGGGWSEALIAGEQVFYSDDCESILVGGELIVTDGWMWGSESGFVDGSDPFDPDESFYSVYSEFC